MGSGGSWGLQKVTFAQCVCEKKGRGEREGVKKKEKGEKERGKERKRGKAGLDQLNDSTVLD